MYKKKAALLFSAILISGCGQKSYDESLLEAQNQLAKSNVKSAVISLKNAVQVAPQQAEARWLLGKVYSQLGAFNDADKELTKALELGVSPEKVFPVFGEVLLYLEDSERLHQYSDVDDNAKFYLAAFYLNKGQEDNSISLFRELAVNTDDKAIYKISQSFVQLFDTGKNALSLVAKIAVAYPDMRYIQQVYARYLVINGKYAEGAKVYHTLVEQSPDYIQMQLYYADALVRSGEYRKADPVIKQLLKFSKHHTYLNYLNAIVDFEDKNFESAKLSAERALQGGYENKVLRMIAGVSAFRLNNFEQAYNHLLPIAADIPDGHDLKKLLAALQISLGYTNDALISVLESEQEIDPDIIAALGYQLHDKDKKNELKSLLKKVDTSKVNSPSTLARIGALKLSLQDDDGSGMADLEKVFSLDSDVEIAKRLLLIKYLDKKEYDKAIELANKLIEEYPTKAEGYNYSAVIYEKMGEDAKVEAAFTHAIKVEPNNAAALLYFVSKSAQNNDNLAVGKYLKQLLDSNPTHVRGLSLNMLHQTQIGKPELGVKAYRKAFEVSGESLAYRLAYARALSKQNKYAEVISLLKPVEKNLNLPDLYWHLLGNANINKGDWAAAEYAYKQWSTFKPNYLLARLSLISAIELTKDYTKALRETESALDTFSGNLRLQLMRIQYLVELRQLSSAQRALSKLDLPDNIFVKALQGRIWLYQGDYKNALSALQAYYQTDSRAQHAIRIAKAYIGLGEPAQAKAFLSAHIEENQQDIQTKLYLANLYIVDEQSKSKALFLEVLAQEKQNFVALNNLANIYLQTGDVEKAIANALNATKYHPNIASGFDTLGSAYKSKKDYVNAKKAYEKALKLNSGSLDILLNYIEILALTGDKGLMNEYLTSLEPIKAQLNESQLKTLESRINAIKSI